MAHTDATTVKNLVADLLQLLLSQQQPQHDLSKWPKLQLLLLPYMTYTIKAALVPPSLISRRNSINNSLKHSRTFSSSSASSSASASLWAQQNTNKLLSAFVEANVSSDAACYHATQLLLSLDVAHINTSLWAVKFRRLKRSRLQACCTIPTNGEYLDFIWESSAIAGEPNWQLRRFGFSDSDDEEHYWRPWELSLADAENDYTRFKMQDHRPMLAPLDVHDLDWHGFGAPASASSAAAVAAAAAGVSSSTNSDTPTEDTVSTYSWNIHENADKHSALSNFQTNVSMLGGGYNPRQTDNDIYDNDYGLGHVMFQPTRGMDEGDIDEDMFGVGRKTPKYPHGQHQQSQVLQRVCYDDGDDDDYWDRYDDQY